MFENCSFTASFLERDEGVFVCLWSTKTRMLSGLLKGVGGGSVRWGLFSAESAVYSRKKIEHGRPERAYPEYSAHDKTGNEKQVLFGGHGVTASSGSCMVSRLSFRT